MNCAGCGQHDGDTSLLYSDAHNLWSSNHRNYKILGLYCVYGVWSVLKTTMCLARV